MKKLLLTIAALSLATAGWADNYGDRAVGSTLTWTCSTASSSGPVTLSGGTVAAYKDDSNTQTTTGVTLALDQDWTGRHVITVDTSTDGTFYSAGSTFEIVITAGTVGGVSAVGISCGSFSLHATSALRPTTSGRTLDVSATGEGGVDWANVGSPTTTNNLSGTTVAAVSGAVGSVTGAVGSVTAGVTVTTNNDKTGYTLSASGVDAIWDEPTPHNTSSTMGALLTAAGAAGDPWATACGGYADGTFGAFLCSLDQTTIEPLSPLLDAGTLELVAGDAYDADHGRSLDDFALTGQPTLSGATVKLVIHGVLEVTATSITGTGEDTQTPIFELTAAQTALLTRKGEKAYRFQIQATWAADTPTQPAVLASGFVRVVERLTP